ncbi:hypothetical protein EJJ20_27080 [Pseudomonas poae]|nr:hypothetical protein EJJ20_27080 [Pseudomonas poae]
MKCNQACSRIQSVSHRIHRLKHRIREQARSHILMCVVFEGGSQATTGSAPILPLQYTSGPAFCTGTIRFFTEPTMIA